MGLVCPAGSLGVNIHVRPIAMLMILKFIIEILWKYFFFKYQMKKTDFFFR